MSPSAERRKRLHDIVHGQRQDLVERFSANGSRVDSDGTPLVVSPEARLSLEAVDDRVTLMIRSPDGERRAVAWEIEQPLLARFATATPPDDVAERAHIARDEVASFCEEMVSAGVLVVGRGLDLPHLPRPSTDAGASRLDDPNANRRLERLDLRDSTCARHDPRSSDHEDPPTAPRADPADLGTRAHRWGSRARGVHLVDPVGNRLRDRRRAGGDPARVRADDRHRHSGGGAAEGRARPRRRRRGHPDPEDRRRLRGGRRHRRRDPSRKARVTTPKRHTRGRRPAGSGSRGIERPTAPRSGR